MFPLLKIESIVRGEHLSRISGNEMDKATAIILLQTFRVPFFNHERTNNQSNHEMIKLHHRFSFSLTKEQILADLKKCFLSLPIKDQI